MAANGHAQEAGDEHGLVRLDEGLEEGNAQRIDDLVAAIVSMGRKSSGPKGQLAGHTLSSRTISTESFTAPVSIFEVAQVQRRVERDAEVLRSPLGGTAGGPVSAKRPGSKRGAARAPAWPRGTPPASCAPAGDGGAGGTAPEACLSSPRSPRRPRPPPSASPPRLSGSQLMLSPSAPVPSQAIYLSTLSLVRLFVNRAACELCEWYRQ